jgi:hypothetical protein
MRGDQQMTLESIKEIGMYGGGILIVLMTLIQITPIKLNPWSWLGRTIGRGINGDVLTKLEALTNDVAKNKADDDEQWASLSRIHILRFGDEIRHSVVHSKEHFDQVLLDIKKYERYCETHKDYENDVAHATIDLIRKKYQKCLEENKFL